MERILERVQRLALLQACRQFRLSQEELCLLHTRVIQLSLNGREVSDPFFFSSPTISITIGNVFAPTSYLEALHTVVNGLQLELLGLVAQPQALCQSLEIKDGLYLDLGGWTTDIAVAKAGEPLLLTSVAWGGRSFTEDLAARLGLSMEQAEKLKLDYCSGWIDGGTRKAAEEILRPSATQWLEEVVGEISSVRGLGVLPHRIYLCGGGSVPPAVGEVASHFPWMERLYFERYPEFSYFHPHQVHGVTDRFGALNSPRETTITALARSGAVLRARERPSTRLDEMLLQVSARSMNSFVLSILESGRGN
jgi:cell division ATPase FtsA